MAGWVWEQEVAEDRMQVELQGPGAWAYRHLHHSLLLTGACLPLCCPTSTTITTNNSNNKHSNTITTRSSNRSRWPLPMTLTASRQSQ